MAERLVARFHDAAAAAAAAQHFRRVIQEKGVPEDVPETALSVGPDGDRGLLELLEELGLVASRGEARRLVNQGAISIDGRGIEDPTRRLDPGAYLIKVGKRRFARVRIE